MLTKFYTLGDVIPEADSPFRNVIDDHYFYLREHPETEKHMVDPYMGDVCRYNLYRYMKDMGFEVVQIYPTMVINKLTNFHDFGPAITSLLIPSVSAIEDIKSSMV